MFSDIMLESWNWPLWGPARCKGEMASTTETCSDISGKGPGQASKCKTAPESLPQTWNLCRISSLWMFIYKRFNIRQMSFSQRLSSSVIILNKEIAYSLYVYGDSSLWISCYLMRSNYQLKAFLHSLYSQGLSVVWNFLVLNEVRPLDEDFLNSLYS